MSVPRDHLKTGSSLKKATRELIRQAGFAAPFVGVSSRQSLQGGAQEWHHPAARQEPGRQTQPHRCQYFPGAPTMRSGTSRARRKMRRKGNGTQSHPLQVNVQAPCISFVSPLRQMSHPTGDPLSSTYAAFLCLSLPHCIYLITTFQE